MTRLEMQQLFLQWVNDPNGSFYSPANFVQPALNRALMELQKQLVMSGDLYYTKSPPATAVTVQNQTDYVLPSDCLKLNRLTIDTDTSTPIPNFSPILPITPAEAVRYGNLMGLPEAYVLTKNKITLYPCPTTANQILRLYYTYQVAQMTSDSDTPDAPEIYHEYIVVLAVIDANIKDETSLTNIKEKQTRYQELMKQMAMDRSMDRPRMIRCLDDGDSWIGF